MKQIHYLILTTLLLTQFKLNAQSQFTTQDEVAEYLEGEWNLDVIQGGFAGVTINIPSPNYYDSTIHKIIFETTQIDSTPLICKAIIADTLYQETFVRISQNPSQIILPRWLLFNVSDNLEVDVGFMESAGFYGFSQDTMVLSGNVAADGFQYGLTRLATNTIQSIPDHEIKIYPNPSSGKIVIEDVPLNTPYHIYTIRGEKIKSAIFLNNAIDIDRDGVYLLTFLIKDKWVVKKVIIHK